MSKLESVYMIICTDKDSGEERWHCSGRGNTPFTATNLSRAKGELTRFSGSQLRTYRLVEVSNFSEVKI